MSNSGERPSPSASSTTLATGRVVPPLAGGLTGPRDHRSHEHEQIDGPVLANERCAESGQRLSDKDEIRKVADGVDDGVDVCRDTC